MGPERSQEPGVVLSRLVEATPADVWAVLMDTEGSPAWLGGFRLECSWTVGEPLAVCGELNGKTYREEGSLLALEPGRLLRYDHWSPLWRIPESPANRAVLELRLEPCEEGTRVDFRHWLPEAKALAEHSRFFWRSALEWLKERVESRSQAARAE